jgi:hypothetical protein
MVTNDALESIALLASADDEDTMLAILLNGWSDDYQQGRKHLLGRLRAYRTMPDAATLDKIAECVYRVLIRFGEEIAEMRWVHLAVECRDMLVYGY